MSNMNELIAAGRLIQWGLHPRARSTTESEYRQLLDRYRDHLPFREIVQAIAEGLGLQIIGASTRGIVLVPTEASIFASVPPDTRSADERLLDGLIHIAIVATLYPLAQDLEEDPTIARPPLVVEHVEATLRDICDRFEEKSRGQPDPLLNNQLAGLSEAWRVYLDRTAARTTSGQRASPVTTTRLIERALEFLHKQGCFTIESRGSRNVYRPTWKYQVQVQEWAATQMYEAVRAVLETEET